MASSSSASNARSSLMERFSSFVKRSVTKVGDVMQPKKAAARAEDEVGEIKKAVAEKIKIATLKEERPDSSFFENLGDPQKGLAHQEAIRMAKLGSRKHLDELGFRPVNPLKMHGVVRHMSDIAKLKRMLSNGIPRPDSPTLSLGSSFSTASTLVGADQIETALPAVVVNNGVASSKVSLSRKGVEVPSRQIRLVDIPPRNDRNRSAGNSI